VVHYGRSRSSKLAENLQCLLFYPPHSRLKPSPGVFPSIRGYKSWSYKTGVSGLAGSENFVILWTFVLR